MIQSCYIFMYLHIKFICPMLFLYQISFFDSRKPHIVQNTINSNMICNLHKDIVSHTPTFLIVHYFIFPKIRCFSQFNLWFCNFRWSSAVVWFIYQSFFFLIHKAGQQNPSPRKNKMSKLYPHTTHNPARATLTRFPVKKLIYKLIIDVERILCSWVLIITMEK